MWEEYQFTHVTHGKRANKYFFPAAVKGQLVKCWEFFNFPRKLNNSFNETNNSSNENIKFCSGKLFPVKYWAKSDSLESFFCPEAVQSQMLFNLKWYKIVNLHI